MQTQVGIPAVTKDKPMGDTEFSWGPCDQVTSKVLGIGATSGVKDAEMGVCEGWIWGGLRGAGTEVSKRHE